MPFVIIFLLLMSTAEAKDFGREGRVYPIKEQNLLDYLEAKTRLLTEEEKEKILSYHQRKLQSPTPISGITEADSYSVHYFDPTIITKEEIKDHEGNTLIPKGKRYNPLHSTSLNQHLLFFDGESNEQLQWAKETKGTWILVKGRPLELEELQNHPIYFDQGGVLCEKFRIKRVPCKVSQEGDLLKIESFPVQRGEK